MNLNLRPFTKSDWYGFAGACRFADGSEPLIADSLLIDGRDATAILDAEGLSFTITDADGNDWLTVFFGNDYAARALVTLTAGGDLTMHVLRAMPGAEVV